MQVPGTDMLQMVLQTKAQETYNEAAAGSCNTSLKEEREYLTTLWEGGQQTGCESELAYRPLWRERGGGGRMVL